MKTNIFDLFKKNNTTNQHSEKQVTNEVPKPETPDVEVPKAEDTPSAENATKETQQNPTKAHIYNLIIVDESGSMSCLREATLSGINETLNTIREAQKKYQDTQKHTLTLVTFDENANRKPVRTIIDNQPIEQVKEFTNYSPCGCTPLYDAVGQSLTSLYQRIKDDAEATGVVTILTDGLENASREWRVMELRQLIEKLKEEGWAFSYMGSAHDVRGVTDLLSIDNVLEFSHDEEGARNTWDSERSSRSMLFGQLNAMYCETSFYDESIEERKNRKRQYAKEAYAGRVTPDYIRTLNKNEIFVFGSNKQGMHSGRAAATAVTNFGAIMGQGEGLQGQSYAIPTMDGMQLLTESIERFIIFAQEHPELRFYVTRIGCGIAGLSPRQVAPLFRDCIKLDNVYLPADFWEVLGLKFNLPFQPPF